MRFALLIVAVVLFTSCRTETGFPPPTQIPSKPYFARVMLDMTPGRPQPWGAAIRAGVDKEFPNLNWRWLSSPSSFSFELENREDWQLELHLTVVDKVLAQVGPQRLIVLLNGKELTRTTLEKPGPVQLTTPAQPGPKPTLDLQIEPCLPQPYGPPYCALLHSLGFARQLTGDMR